MHVLHKKRTSARVRKNSKEEFAYRTGTEYARSRALPFLVRSRCAEGMALLHTVFSAECNNIFDWHSIALFRSHNVSGQVGGITRLLACSKEQLKTYRGLDIGPTFVHPNHRADEGMNYAAFNKPASINYFVHSTALPKDVKYIMQLDADMLIHRPLDPEALGVAPGVVLSAPYDYLVGTTSGLADVFQVKNQQHLARVGGVHVFHIDDIKRIAPLWLNFTERVREFSCRDPERYYELAAPDADRKDQSEEALGRRRQFMWMVEMYGTRTGEAPHLALPNSAPSCSAQQRLILLCPTAPRALDVVPMLTSRHERRRERACPRLCLRCCTRGHREAHRLRRADAVHGRRAEVARSLRDPLRHRLGSEVEGP